MGIEGPSEPLLLGDESNCLAITGIRYESAKPSDPEWLASDLLVCRDGVRHEITSAFMNTDDLLGLEAWFRRLVAKGANESGLASHAQPGPAYYFDDPYLELEALSWNQGGALLRFRWPVEAPWPEPDPAGGVPSLTVSATSEQMMALADALDSYDDELPYRNDNGPDWQTPLALGFIGLMLLLIVVGAVTVVQRVLVLF